MMNPALFCAFKNDSRNEWTKIPFCLHNSNKFHFLATTRCFKHYISHNQANKHNFRWNYYGSNFTKIPYFIGSLENCFPVLRLGNHSNENWFISARQSHFTYSFCFLGHLSGFKVLLTFVKWLRKTRFCTSKMGRFSVFNHFVGQN